MAPTPHARIALITTGGTVAARTGTDGAVPVLSADDLLARAEGSAARGVPTGASFEPQIVPVDLMSVDSSAMTPTEQFRVVAAIADALADPGIDGVVVTHGTDTMEETAFLADLFAADPRPVVFTGAQRPADDPHADGPANIAAALAHAADPGSRSRGVQIVLGGRITPARGAFKASTVDLDVFDSVHDSLPRPLLTGPLPGGHPARVDAYTLYPGVSPGLIAASVSQNAAGIVLAGTGSGNTHPDITAEVSLARQRGVVVVVTTRVPHGPVVATYGGGGGAVDLERAGAILSRWLRAPQARVALQALLTTGCDADEVADFFSASGPRDD
ncbi:asparaginase [Gordonia polyisoprenivorans]|uniref:asparaginase n=1 Tax=Gordonia polyisoprenivorans TaxID=84595 RepID=UPI001AD71C31|nr:asparaginase [Gordonia polyisoprenivorans]QTI67551.1 asparaginase [Gordonia polyisoprenivorans]